MEIFYSDDILDGILRLDAEEAGHCVRVLRHRPGDRIEVIDGRGTLYHCTLLGGDSRGADARIDSSEPGWHSHPYRLTLAVCPTKNSDRYEWMAEKATEIGLDRLVPVIGERSERKVTGKPERLRKILLSAAKQSLKAAIPELADSVSVKDFVKSVAGAPNSKQVGAPAGEPAGTPAGEPAGTPAGELATAPTSSQTLKLIAYCSDEVQPRASIMALLRDFWKDHHLSVACSSDGSCTKRAENVHDPLSEGWGHARKGPNSFTPPAAFLPEIVVLIGPEGDFSPEEVREAMAAGFVPVSIGESRLRTETAAIAAAASVYLSLL